MRINPHDNDNRTQRTLRLAARRGLEARGFAMPWRKRVWEKTLPDGKVVELAFKVDPSGFLPWGSRFTVRLFLHSPDRERVLAVSQLGDAFAEKDESQFLRLQNLVIRDLPPPGRRPGWFSEEENGEWFEHYRVQQDVQTDTWARYRSKTDVIRWWHDFVEPRLDGMVADLVGRAESRLAA
jgi:hypothetical protein